MYSAECSVWNWERSRLYKGGGGAQGGGAECRLLTSGCFLWAKSSAAGAGNETVMV